MIVYKEIKEIAKSNAKIAHLVQKLEDKGFDAYGIEWNTTTFVSLSKEDIESLNLSETEGYYVSQSQGYIEDDFFGHLYFKTNVPGQYVRVYFQM